MAWTDERMDDLASRMDAGFARTDNDIRELRTEIGSLRAETYVGFGDLRTEMHAGFQELRAEVKGDIAELKGEIDALRTLMTRFAIAMIVCLAGVIATGATGG